MERYTGNNPVYDMNTLEPMKNSPLRGKKVLFLGSSVTFGSASLEQGIPEYFGARHGCGCTKEAVSGTTLADIGADSYVRRLLSRVDPKDRYDLLVCQLSTNDAARGIPLGQVCREGGRFDTATVTGAMEFIIRYARETWGCKVAFYTGSQFDSEAYRKMVGRTWELQTKWGIGVLDLWSGDAFNGISEEERALYMADPVHPTKAGYRLWWCPELERQLLAFLET